MFTSSDSFHTYVRMNGSRDTILANQMSKCNLLGSFVYNILFAGEILAAWVSFKAAAAENARAIAFAHDRGLY
jgi:hypothetical protein